MGRGGICAMKPNLPGKVESMGETLRESSFSELTHLSTWKEARSRLQEVRTSGEVSEEEVRRLAQMVTFYFLLKSEDFRVR
jgi:hypothetical protein